MKGQPRKTNLFFVGGFLGSGKTTAILQAARILMSDGVRTGVITNDQGMQQVDHRYFTNKDINTEEVADGCFCCNYDELEDRIDSLKAGSSADVIFAESVGSCTDLNATVINPLLNYNQDEFHIVLSVFADVRLLLRFISGDKSIFYDDVNYIYEKQIEEADVLVVNKMDLLDPVMHSKVKRIIGLEYKHKNILYQSSVSAESVGCWLNCIRGLHPVPGRRPTLTLDYDRYGAGEAKLGWLDMEIGILSGTNDAAKSAQFFIEGVILKIAQKGCPIGHIKFLLDNGQLQEKVSYTTVHGGINPDMKAFGHSERMVILVNARAQSAPETLETIVKETILETEVNTNCRILANKISAFSPGFPRPTHRMIS